MRTCTSCHSENPDLARFCNACGSALPSDAPRESRKLVTVLFCDLADSTGLGVRLDTESLRRVMARYYEEMRAAVERHGGTVEKFIGDAVVAVFGIPQLHEDDAVRAVRAAVEMRDALATLNDELEPAWGVRLRMRTGVNSGEVVAGDVATGQSFVTGGAVNLAARFEQAAEPGEILLGEETLRLVRDAVATEPTGPLSLKGFGDAIDAYRLLEVFPGAAGHARRLDSPLVDRERELALLVESFERTVAGRQSQLFTILGPAGVGKSRLVEELLSRVGTRATTLRGRCLPYGEGITFWPVAEIVTQAAGLADADTPAQARRRIAAVVTGEPRGEQIAERVAQAIGIGENSGTPDETFWAIRSFFEALARRGPLILFLDDVHWAEPTLLDLVEHVAQWSKDVPIMLIALARPDLLELRPTWGGGKVNAATILLEPLTDEESELLVANLLGSAEIAPEARDRVIEVAGGNPFFVEEIVSMLIDEGLLIRAEDRWVAASDLLDVTLPPTISALLAARLERLAIGERAVLETASVIGVTFTVEAVEALDEAEGGSGVRHHLPSLVQKDLVRAVETADPHTDLYRFRHLLIRDAAYEAIPKQRRSDLHASYADWLEEWAGTRAEEYEEILGYHLEQSHRYLLELGPANDRTRTLARRAGPHLAAAGHRAVARGDVSAAVGLLHRALRLLTRDDPLRPRALMDLYDALLLGGDPGVWQRAGAVLDELLSISRESGDRIFEQRALLGQLWLRFFTDPRGTTAEALRGDVDSIIAALSASGDDGGVARALELLGTIHWLTGSASAMLDVGERALRLAIGSGERRGVATAVSTIGRALVLGTTPCSEALARLEALAAELDDDATAQATCRLEMATLLSMLGRFDEAGMHVEAARDTFEDLGQRRWLAGAVETAGLIAWAEGRLQDAERAIRASYTFFRGQDDAVNAMPTASDLAQVLCDLGRYDEAGELADEVRKGAGVYDLEPQIGWRCVHARVLAAAGQHDEAETLVRSALALVESTEFLGLRSDVLVDLAAVLTTSGRTAAAAEALREALKRRQAKEDHVGAARVDARLAELAAAD